MHLSNAMGQQHTVITVDQALYCKLMQLKWSYPAYQDTLIPRLGGLHIQMTFEKVIGQHMKDSGLLDTWVSEECDILGPGVAEQVLAGKKHKKAMRAHKLTLQALWRINLPQFLQWLETQDENLCQEMKKMTYDNLEEIIMTNGQIHEALSIFVATKSTVPNFALWWSYMEMVSIFLLFTRAQHDGIWTCIYMPLRRCSLSFSLRPFKLCSLGNNI